ncbi:hypothetical protein AB1N83_008307, partial [Pleurotus pulmonarius]
LAPEPNLASTRDAIPLSPNSGT